LSLASLEDSPDPTLDIVSRSPLERERCFSPPQAPEDFVSAFPMALPTSFRLGVDQSDRSSVHDWASISVSSAPVLTDTDSSRASSPTHVAETPSSAGPPPLSITSISATSSAGTPSPSVASTSHSAGLSDPPSASRAGLLPPSLGLVVSVGEDSSGSSVSAIRAAYKVSVRKKPSFHRYSWSPGLRDMPTQRELAIIAGQGIDS
jgi:hypothetical protein